MVSYATVTGCSGEYVSLEIENVPIAQSNFERLSRNSSFSAEAHLSLFFDKNIFEINDDDIFKVDHQEEKILEICEKSNTEKDRRKKILEEIYGR